MNAHQRMTFDALVNTIDWLSYYAEKKILGNRQDLIAQACNLETELLAGYEEQESKD